MCVCVFAFIAFTCWMCFFHCKKANKCVCQQFTLVVRLKWWKAINNFANIFQQKKKEKNKRSLKIPTKTSSQSIIFFLFVQEFVLDSHGSKLNYGWVIFFVFLSSCRTQTHTFACTHETTKSENATRRMHIWLFVCFFSFVGCWAAEISTITFIIQSKAVLFVWNIYFVLLLWLLAMTIFTWGEGGGLVMSSKLPLLLSISYTVHLSWERERERDLWNRLCLCVQHIELHRNVHSVSKPR